MSDDTLADLQARLAALDELEAGPHANVPIVRQQLTRVRRYIETLIEEHARGPEAFARALEENKPERFPRALQTPERFMAARAYVTVLPNDENPEQVWIRWDEVPVDLRDDVVSAASLYRDVILDRKIGRPKKTPLS